MIVITVVEVRKALSFHRFMADLPVFWLS